MTDSKAPLYMEGLVKAYAGKRVIDDVTLTLPPGEVTVLVGASGAGKTTLMRLIAGMEHAEAGTIRAGETVLADQTRSVPPEKRHIGLIFQDFALFPHLSVTGNITFGLSHLRRDRRLEMASDWIQRLGLEGRADAFPHQLSGGEQQRVAIARAMAPSPRALLMDEPFSGLDPELRDSTRRLALDVIRSAGIPALLVTHEPVEALSNADRVAVMRRGQIIQSGLPDDVYMNPVDLSVARALGRVQGVEGKLLHDVFGYKASHEGLVYLRPEALQADPGGGVELPVIASRRRGSLCELSLDMQGQSVDCIAILPALPAPGSRIRVRLDPAFILQIGPQS